MATDKQRDANRRNAQLSTGPRSDDGRARSSRNALKHGICVSDLTLKDDEVSQGEIQAIVDQYFDQYHPENLEERDALEELATCKVRLNMIRRVENGALNLSRRDVHKDCVFKDSEGNLKPFFDLANWRPENRRTVANMHLAAAWTKSLDLLDHLSRYEGRIYQRYRRAQDRWDRLQESKAQHPTPPDPRPETQPEAPAPATPSASICVDLRPNNTPPLPPAPPAQNEPNFNLNPSDSTNKEPR